jgi:3-oxoacyl-(acyl-carrier-protein) synthase
MGAFTHYAIAASDQALADSGLQITPENAERVALTAAAASATFGPWIKTGHHSYRIKSTFRHLTISSHVVLRHKPPKQSVKSETL